MHEIATLAGLTAAPCFPTGEMGVCNEHARGLEVDAVVDDVQEDGDVDLCEAQQTAAQLTSEQWLDTPREIRWQSALVALQERLKEIAHGHMVTKRLLRSQGIVTSQLGSNLCDESLARRSSEMA
eukprot:CAMPEP_0171073654 /NCGR_PEP_ID=MMETSP0766_2-20121228/11646_1 /TAXON_ID=439317 /ORGANISM="Gambierdiscus australes, Strain CAWD 149" /LENGTH=124 /DNA_ID=CAMNT_0011530371 /DNA_START=327 /DNA_END=700 /DNA_ORIENTATION=-